MSLFHEYVELLKDPSVPENRVSRKALGLTLVFGVWLFYHRHISLELGFGAELLVTLASALSAALFIGVLGGALAANVYRDFLADIGAQSCEQTFSVFIVELLIAAGSPLFAFIILLAASNEPR